MVLVDLEAKIRSIIKEIESVNIEPGDVGFDDEDYTVCLKLLGEAADCLYGVNYYLDR